MDLHALLTDRLIFVTGKGGTGKTTYASAIAVLQAARGRSTVLCEVDNQRPSLTPVFGVEPDFEAVQVAPNLHVCNLVWPESLVAYLKRMIPIGRVVRSILQNEMIRRFLDFVPGSQELVTLSVLLDLLDRYDCVVVDLPASGHAFSMLDITRSALGLFRGGPIRTRVIEMRAILQRPSTRMVFVALPEEMVINETLETLDRMRRFELLGGDPLVILNRAIPPSLTEAEITLLQRLSAAPLSEDAEEFVQAGRWDQALEEAAAEAQDRLTDVLGVEPVLVPPSGAGGNPREVVRNVAVHLGRHLGISKRELSWS